MLWKTTSFLSKPNLSATHSNSIYECDIKHGRYVEEKKLSKVRQVVIYDEKKDRTKKVGDNALPGMTR